MTTSSFAISVLREIDTKSPFVERRESRYRSRLRTLLINRLRSLYQRLTKQCDLLRDYDKGIQEQLTTGVIERVPDRSEHNNESECNVHYLPHHGVIRKDKSTTKL